MSGEICFILVGGRKGRWQYARFLDGQFTGSSASVEFAWQLAMVREEVFGDVVGFYHTHPKGFTEPSERDIRTMRAWVLCFGKPLLCVIRSGWSMKAYLFQENGHARIGVLKIFNRFIWR